MAITAYRQLVTANKRLLGFGFVMALCSSFGQTFFIGIVGPDIQREFSLSHTLWGTIYMVGTLLSAALLPWTGALIDRLRLRSYALAACLLLIGACALHSECQWDCFLDSSDFPPTPRGPGTRITYIHHHHDALLQPGTRPRNRSCLGWFYRR